MPRRFAPELDTSRTVGQLRFTSQPGQTLIQGDVNGDKTADLTILLPGVTNTVAADWFKLT